MQLSPTGKAVRCLGLLLMLQTQSFSQTRQPVISKVEFIFSMVSHYNHLGERINFYNTAGSPAGNTNYAVPHLVYEPVVTLYNPYNEVLTLTKARVKISDPPVGFTFKKNSVFLRPEFSNGSFIGLARLQISNESNIAARKSFTLLLRGTNASGQPGSSITLQPGQSRTFSSWVETNWTWGLETAGGYTVRSFFDWNNSNDFTNRDPRTNNAFGVETIPGPLSYLGDARAGFQTDGLSLSARPAGTRYDFETASNWGGNWVAIKLNDSVTVEAKAMRTFPVSSAPDFQVELLRGQTVDPAFDRVKAFPMSVANIIQEPFQPIISRTYRVGDILQGPNDNSPGGKSPFASVTLMAKTKALRRNSFYQTPAVPTADLYELHFDEMTFFNPDPVVASDAPTAAPEVTSVVRSGNTLYVDFTGRPDVVAWKVRGTSSLAAGFNDILTGVMPGPPGTGIHKAIIDITGRGDRYFIRIEE